MSLGARGRSPAGTPEGRDNAKGRQADTAVAPVMGVVEETTEAGEGRKASGGRGGAGLEEAAPGTYGPTFIARSAVTFTRRILHLDYLM